MLSKKSLLLLVLSYVLLPLGALATDPPVLINEVAWMGTVASANAEWIELKNTGSDEIDLAGWQLIATDGAPSITLNGKIPANGYYLLERTGDQTLPEINADQIYTGALSNTGEWLKLLNKDGNLIDQVDGTGGWPAGDNTAKQTMEKTSDLNWQTSAAAGGTPKADNSTAEAPAENPETTSPPAAADNPTPAAPAPTTLSEPIEAIKKGDIVINEIFANPAGIDTEEFIEIKNVSKYVVDISSWKITNAAKNEFLLPSLVMGPNSLVVFYRQQTNLVLNNLKEKITLYSKSGRIIDTAECKIQAEEGKSYQKTTDGYWGWDMPTPAKENTYKKEVLPVAIIYGPKQAEVFKIIDFEASDSFDPLNRPLTYHWQFGDGRSAEGIAVRQLYNQAGSYKVSLVVSASQTASTTEDFKITITDPNKQTNATTTATSTPELEKNYTGPLPLIFISEVLPNPAGPDDQEFIELFNQDNYSVNLYGFKLADSSDKTFTISDQIIIKPGQYLAFYKDQTKISLNNDSDTVRLLSPNDIILDQLDYESAKEKTSFAVDNNFTLRETLTPTPGAANILNEVLKEESASSTPKVLGAEIDALKNINQCPANNNIKYVASVVALAIIAGLLIFRLKRKPAEE